jgi:hypothetical protein
MNSNWKILLLIAVPVIAGCTSYRMAQYDAEYGKLGEVDRYIEASAPGQVSFHDDVQPIIERRCSVCHSCYDAPCQLKMTSFEGIDRGGSTELVYDAARIKGNKPTRLFVDADTTQEWRDLDFHPVLNERNQTPETNLELSVLNRMLQLKKEFPLPESGLIPETFDLRLNHDYICTTAEEFGKYEQEYPLWGMPFALPGLTEIEHTTIADWLKQGAKVLPKEGMSDQAIRIVADWEDFFNGESLKQQLMARYIYEHLFLGHLHFEQLPDREFYRLVRSKTPPGEEVEEINTVKPYDDPGVEKFYYRLRRLESTIVAKNHTVYHINAEKQDRYRELFLQDDYVVSELPSYDKKASSNAFRIFAAIPSQARYQFMLDDAGFFIMGFIKGPVCRGQIALNVVNDHFFVAFTDPENDSISNDTAFLSEVKDSLRLPTEKKGTIRIMKTWLKYRHRQREYLKARNQYLKKLDPAGKGRGIEYIWNGGGSNDNALLTVFRHFDSATVVKGFVGKMPETGWIVDYPLFERIHYLLVAGFNIHGNVGHQAGVRIFMDYLRMEGESNFLSFLPKDKRQEIWDGWYVDAWEEAVDYFVTQFDGLERETQIDFSTTNPKDEFFEKLMAHVGTATVQHDHLNRCTDKNCIDENAGPLEQAADIQMQRLAEMRGEQLQWLPDVAFVHVVLSEPEQDLIYTVIRNKALSNNSMMAKEDSRRRLEDDSLTVVKAHIGSYPNSFSKIPVEELESIVDGYLKIKDSIDYFVLAQKEAIQRNSPIFWEESDWHYRTYMKNEPIEGGLFDLYRFLRIGEKADAKLIEW